MANSPENLPDQRALVIEQVARHLAAQRPGHPLRVGIDGVCGAGKSTFARELARAVEGLGRPAVLVDSDGFHHVRAHRRRQGADSARGYYEDAYDFESLAERVLKPLGPGGDLTYAVTVHDLATDEVITDVVATAPADAVAIFDATFIQGEVLDGLWDEMVYVHADEAVALARGIARDSDLLGGGQAARDAHESRYMAACRIYLRERNPRRRASIIIDNTDIASPFIERPDMRRQR